MRYFLFVTLLIAITSSATELRGYGIVTGLNGTGCTPKFSREAFITHVKKAGCNFDADTWNRIKTNRMNTSNKSLVVVTAKAPAHGVGGRPFDVHVTVVDDSTDIDGGSLVPTLLLGIDGKVYGTAEGWISPKGKTKGIIVDGATMNYRGSHVSIDTAMKIVSGVVRP